MNSYLKPYNSERIICISLEYLKPYTSEQNIRISLEDLMPYNCVNKLLL